VRKSSEFTNLLDSASAPNQKLTKTSTPYRMTNRAQDDGLFNSDLYLSPKEQDLLLTALNSNKPNQSAAGQRSHPQVAMNGSRAAGSRSNSTPQQPAQSGRKSLENTELYASPLQQAPGSALLGNISFEGSPYLDFDPDDGNFDWDINGDQLIGSLPGTSVDEEDGDLHDKRKASDDDGEENDGGGKRREGEDKVGKKPGRKPLTSEPTSVSRDTHCHSFDTNYFLETQGPKSRRSESFPRKEGETSQGA